MAELADDLIQLIQWGRELCHEGEAWAAHAQFAGWKDQASKKIRTECSSELALEWEALPGSGLERFGVMMEPADSAAWVKFTAAVDERCRWLGKLPSRMSAAPERVQSSALAAGRKEVEFGAKARAFVYPDRIEELKEVGGGKFDLSKLIRMCEEINICFAMECYFAVAMLTRSILDHVPPVFGCDGFTHLANNYAGSKSFKESMQILDNSSRKIADQHLHTKIRSAEVLPNVTQVDFSQPLDVLLSEIVRIHKRD